MSARSGMVATTRIFLAPAACAGSSATRAKRTEKRRFMKPSLPVTEAVDVTAHDDRPLQEEFVLRRPPNERTERRRSSRRPNTTGTRPSRTASGASKDQETRPEPSHPHRD